MSPSRAISLACAIVCAASALLGSYVAARAFGATTERFTLGTVRVAVKPALRGRVDVYVPIVDWGVRAHPFDAPVAFDIRFRSLDRDAALATLRRGGTDSERHFGEIRAELAGIGRNAMLRGAFVAVVGGLVGGLVGGALVGAALHRRRWLGIGAAVGAAVSLVATAISLATVRGLDYGAFQRPTFYAHGAELPRLLSLSDNLVAAGERYTKSYEQVLAGLSRMVASAGTPQAPADSGRAAIVASDLHANALVLPVLAEFAQEKTVFLVGDMTLFGTKLEAGLASRISQMGQRVVAVSGNHDSRPFMRALARAGVQVLVKDGSLSADGSVSRGAVVEVDGLAVAGYEDPLENPTTSFRDRSLELSDDELAVEQARIVTWFDGLPERPDVVLVHQHSLAHSLMDALQERPGRPVAIFTGHDHVQHVERNDRAVLVDGGTVGAGGPWQIGVLKAGFAEVHFSDDNVVDVVDLIEIEPLTGNARAVREVTRR